MLAGEVTIKNKHYYQGCSKNVICFCEGLDMYNF